MASKLEVDGIKVVGKDERGYILENDTIIDDTFAGMFYHMVTTNSIFR